MVATKVELFELIRRDSWHGGLSVRALAGKYGVHRRLVREALMHAEPDPRKTPERRSARLEPFKAVIDGWLRADLDAPRKQRHTATRVHARLLDEHGAGDVSYAAVRDYVARRRPEIRIEEGRGPAKVFIPQHHPPGMEAEVDFGELWVRLAGVLVKCYLFAFRMSYSGKAVHRPVDRTNGPFLVDPPRPGPLTGQASSSLITRMEAGWIRTRRPGSAMCRGWLFPGSGRCAQPVIRCCHGWWPMSSASGSTRSMTSLSICWPAATALPRAVPTPMTCCGGFGSWRRSMLRGSGRSAVRCAISSCGCARAPIRRGTGSGVMRRRRGR